MALALAHPAMVLLYLPTGRFEGRKFQRLDCEAASMPLCITKKLWPYNYLRRQCQQHPSHAKRATVGSGLSQTVCCDLPLHLFLMLVSCPSCPAQRCVASTPTRNCPSSILSAVRFRIATLSASSEVGPVRLLDQECVADWRVTQERRLNMTP